jgi:hypothetical protein
VFLLQSIDVADSMLLVIRYNVVSGVFRGDDLVEALLYLVSMKPVGEKGWGACIDDIAHRLEY